MRYLILCLSLAGTLLACSSPKEKVTKSMPAKEFIDSIQKVDEIQLVDIRTQEEFSRGALPNAINVDISDSGYKEKMQTLDKSKPVYIYCLSGERTKEAAKIFADEGFEYIVTMEKGLLGLNELGKPRPDDNQQANTSTKAAVSIEQFDSVIAEKKNVIVDFYADWCGPCKRMTPVLEQLAQENSEAFTLLKVNIDYSRELAVKYKISSIPRLFVYKNGKQVDDVMGFNPQPAAVEEFKTRLLSHYKK